MKKPALLFILAVVFISSAFVCPDTNVAIDQHSKVIKKHSLVAGFDFFRIHRQGRYGVTAAWGFTATSETVTGFIVERTYEDPSDPYATWEPAGIPVAPGLRSYKSTDTNVAPGFISYRVKALIGGANPSVVYSGVETIHIVAH